MSSPIIELNHVCHQYKSTQSSPLYIEHWQVQPGQQVFLQGQSGSGKSTLLNLLSGVLTAKSGEINILGQDLCQMSGRERDRFRAKHIGVVFQTFNLIAYLSVIKNIELAVYFAKGDKQAVVERAKQLLSKLQLSEDILSRKVSELSIGQQQRVAIVRALINQPELLLVDEPTSALDSAARDAFLTMLTSTVSETPTTMIFVSHDKTIAHHFSQTLDISTLLSKEHH